MKLKFQNLITPEMVAREQGLIDACGFYSVTAHYFSEESEITEVHVIDESIDLAELGAFYKQSGAGKQETAEAISELLEKGLIRNADPRRARISIFGHESYTFAEIGLDREVHVLYAAPFYLVKLTEGVWR